MQRRGYALLGLLCGQPLHQRLGLSQELLVRGGIRPALLDEIVEQFRHLLVEPGVGELLADDGLADVVDDPFGDGVLRERPFSLSFLAMASWMGVPDNTALAVAARSRSLEAE